ncbi:Glu/Leu/Phe/Val dehydrogenase dimerization domain-containing protein [Litorimonas sp. RW-G-Af-16]|uniref:Glu/Leu/Phe/Val dehydrogenase dimerization domain-containing protein n=1 Tax=Litorimonas sp. RW-G-Af-16 TaxID=3241168 RepID=UPI00390C4CC6
MTLFSHPDFDDHEGVYIFSDPKSGLRAIIAVHNTKFGPGCGGTRFWTYADDASALTDALRLSRAMSFKNAMAGLDLGGGKGVILRPKGEFDRASLFASYGRAIEKVAGQYITAEDVGVSPDDMCIIKTQTDYVAGLDDGEAASGDPSPVTARGIFYGLQTAVVRQLKQNDFSGLRVAIQGLGHVGYGLCEHLYAAGAELVVADINQSVLEKARAEFGASVVSPETIHAQDVDVFAPCALGGAISADTVEEIKAAVIGGAANNQLATPDMGERLVAKGILYCPDYIINAGGIINVASEVSGTYDPDWVESKVLAIKNTLTEIFDRAAATGQATSDVADAMAAEKLR